MDDEWITAAELQTELQADVKVQAEQIAQAINTAKAGRIIGDSEALVRDAHAEFRHKAYQRALDLLQAQLLPEDFSPSAQRTPPPVEEQGPAKDLAPDGQWAAGTGADDLLEQAAGYGGAAGSTAGRRRGKLQSGRSRDGLPSESQRGVRAGQ
jgi:hypothetical protein